MAELHESLTPDYALLQGEEYEIKQEEYLSLASDVNLRLLEETTGPHLGSVIEGLKNRTIGKENENVLDTMKQLENQFNTTLAEYSAAYKSYMSQITEEDTLLNEWKGKNVWNDGQFNQVNKFGYTRAYGDPAWDKKPSGCSTSPAVAGSQNVYNNLQHGESMGTGEPCGLEGTNIRNSDNDKLYWLSPKGVLHHYPDTTIWDATMKNGGCPSGQTDLPNSVVSTMVIGTPMNSVSKCDTMNLNSALWQRIQSLNDELLELSEKMYSNIQHLEQKDDVVDEHLQTVKTQLHSRIKDLHNERTKMQKVERRLTTLQGEFQETAISTTREYTHYLAWFLGALTLGVLAFKHVTK